MMKAKEMAVLFIQQNYMYFVFYNIKFNSKLCYLVYLEIL